MSEKVLLIHCSQLNEIAPIVTMGLWGIADGINKAGYQVKIVNTKVTPLLENVETLNELIDSNTIMVGFSIQWFPNLKESLYLAAEIKKNFPYVAIAFGGFTASFYAETIIKNYKFIDAVICGDGEAPILQYIEALKSLKNNSQVENLVYRNAKGEVIKNPITYVTCQEFIKDISFSNFSRYLYDYEENRRKYPFNIKYSEIANFDITNFRPRDTFFLFTGKGCNVNCSYCGGSHETQLIINNRCRCFYMDAEKIISTIEQAIVHGYRSFYVCFDPLPNKPVYVEWLDKLADLREDVDLFFGFWNLPPLDVVSKFKNVTSNLIFEISPESISENIRSKNRGFSFSNKEFYQTLDFLEKEEVYTWVYFSYPLAYETYDDVRNTRKAFWSINSKYTHYIEAFYLKQSTDPGSPIYNNPDKYDMAIDSYDLEYHMGQTNKRGNILIHHHKSEDPILAKEYKKILFDNMLKKIFRYPIKYLVKAFEDIDEFIRFIDCFYEREEIEEAISDYDFLMRFNQYVTQNVQYWKTKDYILELVNYMAEQETVYLKKEIVRENVKTDIYKSINELTLRLNPHIWIGAYHYNLIEAYTELVSHKKYMEIEKLENPEYFALFKTDNGIQFIQMNETLYLLVSFFFKSEGIVEEKVKKLASLYGNSEEELNYVMRDLEKAVVKLYDQGVLIKTSDKSC